MRTRTTRFTLAVLGALWAAPALAEPSEWTIDPAHTRVGFNVSHMVISEVDGEFKKFTGKVQLDDKDLTKSAVEFTIEAGSIDTGNEDRDKHLRSPDFFDVQKFPTLSFKSTKITKAGKGYKVKGDLTIHGVTKPVTLDAQVSEPLTNPWGKQVRGVKISGKVKRGDFGLTWNKTLDKGGLLVGEDVAMLVKLELNK
jgi:polyisoprenoid-binding protein YceI